MGIVNLSDIDKKMKAHITPDEVPKHNGGDHGVMEGRFLAQSEHIEVQQGHGRRGATEVAGSDVSETGFYGSGTVVSLSELEQLPAGMEPRRAGAPAADGSASAPVAPVQPTVTRQRTAQEVVALMLGKNKPQQ